MTFHVHDTLSDTKLALPLPDGAGETKVYQCGPTVYNYIHVGNARPAVVFDVLVRHLRASGRAVRFVRNYTDIDDKIIKAALAANEEPAVIAQRYIDAYVADTRALNCRPPDAEPRVSEHLPAIVDMISTLVARGNAYVRDGDVYFAVRTFDGYGKLSKRDLSALRAGERVAVDERKDDPLDFALWKSAKPHEPAGARWPSPWGPGRPGWHIECSAMARALLGDTVDIHAGGMDLIFPHHENEIAQSECATGAPFARTWMHNGFVNIADADEHHGAVADPEARKVSKSRLHELGELGAFFVLRNVLRHVDPEAVRLWLLGTHYRAPIAFELFAETTPDGRDGSPGLRPRFPGLEDAEKRVAYLHDTRERLTARAGGAPTAQELAEAERRDGSASASAGPDPLRERFDQALDDDLNTAGALAPMAEAYRRANELCDSTRKDKPVFRALGVTLAHMAAVTGVAEGDAGAFFARVNARRVASRGLDAAEIDGLVAARAAARKQRDFALADTIRKDLLARGIEVRDNAVGSTWRAV